MKKSKINALFKALTNSRKRKNKNESKIYETHFADGLVLFLIIENNILHFLWHVNHVNEQFGLDIINHALIDAHIF